MGRRLLLALALGLWACIDIEDGESGYYASPCSGSFYDILLCGRETGGTDPADISAPTTTEPEGPFTCADTCQLIADCGFGDPSQVDSCTSGCLQDNVPQSLLDCFRDNGCDFQICIEGGG